MPCDITMIYDPLLSFCKLKLLKSLNVGMNISPAVKWCQVRGVILLPLKGKSILHYSKEMQNQIST